MKSRLTIFIFFLIVRCIIIYCNCLYSILIFLLFSSTFNVIIKFRMMRNFLGNLKIINRCDSRGSFFTHLFLIFIYFRIFLVFVIRHFNWERTFHQTFIFCCYILRCSTIYTISIITATNK